MTDRNVQYPKRYQMVPVQGTTDIVDLTPAPGEIYDEGTMINKATLLKDTTAALFGLGTDAVPDAVLAYLGQYAQHWWKRRLITKIPTETNAGSSSSPILLCHTNAGMYKIPVSNSIKYDYSADKFVQENPVIHDFEQTGETLIPQVKAYLLNKYVVKTNLGEIVENSPLYRVTEDTVLEYNSNSPRGLDAYNLKIIGSTDGVGSWQYVQSSDRNAYPDSGEQDGYEYEYLGIPFDNAVGAPKVETGSYVGTGTYGSSNPNSLTFGFVPKLVVITGNGVGEIGILQCSAGARFGVYMDTKLVNSATLSISVSGNSVSWYSYTPYQNGTAVSNAAAYQLNTKSSYAYTYLAIG